MSREKLINSIETKQTQVAIDILSSNSKLLNTLINGRTPLHHAIQNNNLELVVAITAMKGLNLEVKTQNNLTPACLACFENIDASILEHLINIGADLRTTNANDLTPLMIAAKKNRLECVNLLITCGRSIRLNHCTASGESALTYAIRFGTADMVRSILSIRKIRTDNAINNNQTPLLIAATRGDVDILLVLLQFPGINVALDGMEAFGVAKRNGHDEASNLILRFLISDKLHLIRSLSVRTYNALMQDKLVTQFLPSDSQTQTSDNNNERTEIVSFDSYLELSQASPSQLEFANYLDAICGKSLLNINETMSLHEDVYPTLIFVGCRTNVGLGDYASAAQIAFLVQSYLDTQNIRSQCFLISTDQGVQSFKILYGQEVTIFNRSFPAMSFQSFLSSPYAKNTVNFIQIGFCLSPRKTDVESLLRHTRFPINFLYVSRPTATDKFMVKVNKRKESWLPDGKKVAGLYTGFGQERIGLPIVIEKTKDELSKNSHFITQNSYGFVYANAEESNAHQFVRDYILLSKKSAQNFIIIDKQDITNKVIADLIFNHNLVIQVFDERTNTEYFAHPDSANYDQPNLYFMIVSKISNSKLRQFIRSAIDIVAISGAASFLEALAYEKIPFHQSLVQNENFINSYKKEMTESVKSHPLQKSIIEFSDALMWSRAMSDKAIDDLLQLSLNPGILSEVKNIHRRFFQKTPLIGERICQELYFPNVCLKTQTNSNSNSDSGNHNPRPSKKAKYLTNYVKTLLPQSLKLDDSNVEDVEKNNQRSGTIKYLIEILNNNPTEKILPISSEASSTNKKNTTDKAMQKTLVSRSIASIGSVIHQEEKQFWLDGKHLYLGRLIFWQKTYNNYKDKKLIQELRKIQHISRITNKNNCFDDWIRTINKYCCVMEQALLSSDLDKIVSFKRLQSIKNVLQTDKKPVSKYLQEEINRHIDHLMDIWSDLQQEEMRRVSLP